MDTLPQSTLICLQFLTDEQFEELECKMGTKFKHRALLAQALTHRSCHFVLNGRIIIQSNEKLEHLGDKVIGLAVCKFLHMKYPEENEDFYSQVLGPAVSNSVLGEAGKSFDLGRFLITRNTGLTASNSKNVLADLVEAISAALFLDQGSDAVDRFLSQCLYPQVEEIAQQKKKAG